MPLSRRFSVFLAPCMCFGGWWPPGISPSPVSAVPVCGALALCTVADAAVVVSGKAPRVAYGVDPNASVWASCRVGDFQTFKDKLRSDPSLISARDPEGHTALHWFTLANNKDAVRRLLSLGAEVRCQGACCVHIPLGFTASRAALRDSSWFPPYRRASSPCMTASRSIPLAG